jgi:hypothetical protein
MTHTSACAVHNEPAGPCDCGAWADEEAYRLSNSFAVAALSGDGSFPLFQNIAAALIAAERRGRINSMREAEIIAAMHDKPLGFIRSRATAIEAGEA